MAPFTIALALMALLAAPATASENAKAKKSTSDGHKPAATGTKHKTAGGRGEHEASNAKAKGDHDEHGAKAKPNDQPGHDDHGASAKAKAAPSAEKEGKARAHVGEAQAKEHREAESDHGTHKDAPEARRARIAAGTDLHTVTQRIKDKIVEIPRFRSAPARPATVAHPKPAPKTELVWRQGLSWPPSLDAAWEPRYVDADASINLSWAMDDRCSTPAAEPELPSEAWPAVAGLAPSRCCGLFLTK